MNGFSADIANSNIDQLKALFPDIFSEGKIDFDKFKQVLGEYIDENQERYNFTWNGKGKALRLAQTPSSGTLRPCIEESKDWNASRNLYIEGDNLEVLKLMQKSYHGKVKMIYIDPPYNTGNEFVYPDDYADSIENYKQITSQVDSDGRSISTNTETNGRYHTDWLNMMYPRLRLARNLLNDNGVIFINIDDNEVENLRKICDEVFGESNFIGTVIWERAFAPKNDAKYISNSHDYILIYAKNLPSFGIGKLERTDEANSRYKNLDNDPRGVWASDNLTVKTYSASYDYEIATPSGKRVRASHGSCWRVSEERLAELIRDNRIWFGEEGDNVPRLKRFLSEVQDGMTPTSIWTYKEVGHNQEGRQELKALFDDRGYFDGPKPVRLLRRILRIANTEKDAIILDFFSGSSTTAHAIMQLNAEDGGARKFIMVQLPEPCEKESEAFKAGYKNICEIGKERIRRAGEKIRSEMKGKLSSQASLFENDSPASDPQKLDIGFKVFKLDSSNLKKWNPDYQNIENSLDELVGNYVPNRSELDIVYEIILKYGIDLDYPISEHEIVGCNVYSIGSGALVICLAEHISVDLAFGIVLLKNEINPEMMRVVMKDNGFEDDCIKTNIKEIFKNAAIEEFVTI